MSPYYEHVTLPFELNLTEFAKFDCGLRDFGYLVKDHSTIDSNLVKFLAGRGMYISHTALFHTPPFARLPVHSDIPSVQNFAKLNVCGNAEGSRMFWYKLLDGWQPAPLIPDDSKKYHTPPGNVPSYVSIPDNRVQYAASTKVKVTWVNASIPHSVLNNTPERRWVVSMPLRDLETKEMVNFEEGARRFAA